MVIEINAETRTDLGKGASRRLRHQENVDNELFYASIVNLKIDGKKTAEKVIVRDIQHHPYKIDIMHLDFQRIDAKKKMHMHVQLHFTGEDIAPGVKLGGGIISHVINEVEVECLPKDIPEYIEVDISALDVGESVHLTELKIPKGVELLALKHGDEDHDTAVVSIHAPKVIVETDDVEEDVVEGEAPTE